MNILQSFDLTGKTALVSGAAGMIGKQIARAMLQAGARTFLAGRSREKLDAFANSLRQEGYEPGCLTYDQSREESVQTLLNEVIRQTDSIDVLVNNAVERPMADWSSNAAAFERSMTINATGQFLMTRVFGDQMARQGRGSIIQVGSIQGMVGPDYSLYEGLDWGVPPDYFVHKGGQLQLTRFAAAKLGPHGVRVNAISPGGFFNHQDPRFVERYNQRTFLGRMLNETDIMGVVVFLASDASAYITGANIPVDGGYTAK